MAEVGIESTLAGTARRLHSETRAAWVYWLIISPESTPGSSARKGGRPWMPVQGAIGAPLGHRAQVGCRDRQEVQDVPTGAMEVAIAGHHARGKHHRIVDGGGGLRSATRRAWAMVSRTAPVTWGAQRSE
jgi:hypothetical protein